MDAEVNPDVTLECLREVAYGQSLHCPLALARWAYEEIVRLRQLIRTPD